MLPLLAACSGFSSDPSAEMIELFIDKDQRAPVSKIEPRLESDDPHVRLLAVQALGALRDPAAAEPLGRALDDPQPWVRYEAAFALGQLRGRAHAELLVPGVLSEDPNLRLLAVAALGKVGRAAQLGAVLARLADDSAEVRGAAAISTGRMLGDRLRQRPAAPGISPSDVTDGIAALSVALAAEKSPAARWRQVYALAHLGDPRTRPTLEAAAGRPRAVDDLPRERWARMFAIRGLGALAPDQRTRARLLEQLHDRSRMILIETIRSLTDRSRQIDPAQREVPGFLYPGPQVGLEVTARARSHASAHVRATAVAALGHAVLGRAEVAELLVAALGDPSPTVRSAAVIALARVQGDEAAPRIATAAADADWRMRVAAARAAAFLAPELAFGLWGDTLLADPDVRVRTAVAEALADSAGAPAAVEILDRLARERDIAIREACATTARRLEDAGLVPMLKRAFADSEGGGFAEARKAILVAVAELDRDEPGLRRWLAGVLGDPSFIVRSEAARRLRELGVEVDPAKVGRPTGLVTPRPGTDFPADFQVKRPRPRIQITTEKGLIEITLHPELAPVHCLNLLTLVENGKYAGRIFHRVVPNFVVQGGDARGDGYGATAWHGGRLRDELNPMPFTAWVVGMPKSADPDTGGDQIFITTVPTPHLDGEYTAFGRVSVGFDVVESLEVGDSIVEITVSRG